MLIEQNAVINGQFDIWQQTTSTSVEGWLTADHWVNTIAGTSTQTVSRQAFTAGQTEVPAEPRYFLRASAVGGSAGSDLARVGNYIEDARTFANTTATIDFWARRAAGTGNLRVYLNQYFGVGGSAQATNGPDLASLASGWQRFSFIVKLASIEDKTIVGPLDAVHVFFVLSEGTPFPQTVTVDLANVQVIEGHGRKLYLRRTVAEEFRVCQRLFCKSFARDTMPATAVGLNTGEYSFPAIAAGTATQRSPTVQFPVRMRGIPTIQFFNPVLAGVSTVQDVTAGGPGSTATAINVSETGFVIAVPGHPSTAIGNDLRIHWAATAVH